MPETSRLMSDLDLLPRGVYKAPCLGPHHETIFYAVRTDHCHIAAEEGGVVYLQPGDNPFKAMHDLWERLDAADPVKVSRELPATG